MSVYRDTNSDVVFEHPIAVPLTATVYREGQDTPILTASDIAKVDGVFTLPLTYNETLFDGKLRVVWTAGGFSRTQTVEVVTPLVNLARLRTLFPGENKTDPELAELEQTVRVFIEAYCGQKFGYSVGSRTVVGTGGTKILLDTRLNTITAFSGGWPANARIVADGWAILLLSKNLLETKEAPPEEFQTYLSGQGGVIRIPDSYIKCFNKGATFTVTGEWGYEAVPDEVQEAAMLLANDFSCNEILYRDRYLESIKIQQDSFTYFPGAFRGTGNARADLLLAGYKRSGMVII